MKPSLLLLLSLIIIHNTVNGKNYYISSSGNDMNSGLSDTAAWKTINKLNSSFSNFVAGDSILFNRGDEFYGTIAILKSGSSSNSIVLGDYGNGANPVIPGFTNISGWNKITGINIWE